MKSKAISLKFRVKRASTGNWVIRLAFWNWQRCQHEVYFTPFASLRCTSYPPPWGCKLRLRGRRRLGLDQEKSHNLASYLRNMWLRGEVVEKGGWVERRECEGEWGRRKNLRHTAVKYINFPQRVLLIWLQENLHRNYFSFEFKT